MLGHLLLSNGSGKHEYNREKEEEKEREERLKTESSHQNVYISSRSKI